MRCIHGLMLESAWSHFRSVFVERAAPEDDEAFHAICFSPRLRAVKTARALALFGERWSTARWTAARDIDGPSATPWLSSYTPLGTLRRIAHHLRVDRDSWRNRSASRPTRSAPVCADS